MPSSVTPAMDQRLVEGMTYIYQGMQTQIHKVTVLSAARMNIHLDTKARSSWVLEIFMLQITKCLDSTSDIKQITLEH